MKYFHSRFAAKFLLPLMLASLCAASCSSAEPAQEPADLDAGVSFDSARPARDAGNQDASNLEAGTNADSGPLVIEETLTAKVDTFIKIATADSASLAADAKCAIAKGAKVSLARITDAGNHTGGRLMSAHACGGNFVLGSPVYVFTDHFTGWSAVPRLPQPVSIVDDPANYAASCQYRAASRTRSEITRIVLHNTEGRWVNFKSTWQACNRIGAAHFVILRTGVVMRTIAEKNVAYHATVANTDSIGVEIESGPGFEGMTPVQEAAVIALTSKLQSDFGAAPAGIPTSRVTMHRLAAPGSTDCAKFIWPLDSDFTTWRRTNL